MLAYERSYNRSFAGKVVEFPPHLSQRCSIGGARRAAYVRTCYLDVFDDPHSKVVVEGDPGIGKSTFLKLAVLWYYSHECSVLISFIPKSGESTYVLFHHGWFFTLPHIKSYELLGNNEEWYRDNLVLLIDSRLGFHDMAFVAADFKRVIVVHSPSAEMSSTIKVIPHRSSFVLGPVLVKLVLRLELMKIGIFWFQIWIFL